MKRLVIGMTAHVDAGKTTLAEAMMYLGGELRKIGRVDHGNSFLDTHDIERNRGITVFSKQAVMHTETGEFILLDTPGHIDFSAETERAVQVLDYAVLVISGTDGIQSHTETLWELLKKYHVPVFIFINKCDISVIDRNIIISLLREKLSDNIVDFSENISLEELYDNLALCSEKLMEYHLDNGNISDELIAEETAERNIFPCCCGSALKVSGIDRLIEILEKYTVQPHYSDIFGARVYKITTENGVRLTHMKITGGSLKVRSLVKCGRDGETHEEKVNQIRIYSGAKYISVDEAESGMICAATGLSSTFAGEGLGCEKDSMPPLLEPVLSYRIIPPDGTDMHLFFGQIKKLEEEEPQLHICFNEQLHEIYVRIMGEVQLEILETLIKQRFGIDVTFGEGSIAYKETIAAPVVGIGHYEPLRHYAEVHLLIEPLEEGSGLVFDTSCSEDVLAGNWQRLILTHLAEKTHIGVLTGSPITDMRITVVSGKSHIKHTEGGDFRQATYRAVRMGLKSAESILLEPYYSFRIEVPAECLGRTLSDLQQMDAEFSSPMSDGNTAELTGNVPVSEIRGYHTILSGYTHGKGRLSCMFKGYYPCRNADEVIEKIGYDSDADVDNPSDSIFCSSGATIVVKWDEVRKRSHMDSGIYFGGDEEENTPTDVPERSVHTTNASDDELMEIFERTYGKIRRDPIKAMRRDREENDYSKSKPVNIPSGPVYLLVDGYNIIFAWDELRKLAAESLDLARSRLINILCSYQGYKQCRLILVFDAYKVAGNNRETEKIGGITVIYTKESETADMYIEKAAYKLAKENRVRVATSDGMEQMIIMGRNAYRVSANEFYEEVRAVERELEEIRYTNSIKGKNTISGL